MPIINKKRWLLIGLVFLAFVGFIQWKSTFTEIDFVVGSAISDMYVVDIMEDHGNYYALLKSHNQQNNVGMDFYFNEPRWLKISDSFFSSGNIEEGKAYSSISIQFVVPKSIARSSGWIYNDTLSTDLFLHDEAYNPDYLWIVSVLE